MEKSLVTLLEIQHGKQTPPPSIFLVVSCQISLVRWIRHTYIGCANLTLILWKIVAVEWQQRCKLKLRGNLQANSVDDDPTHHVLPKLVPYSQFSSQPGCNSRYNTCGGGRGGEEKVMIRKRCRVGEGFNLVLFYILKFIHPHTSTKTFVQT